MDSAELCYRKVYYPNMNYLSATPMYKGLLSVYQTRHETDSIAKYADLYCMSVDSSTILKDRELTAQMAASYNYSLYQKLSQKETERVYQAYLLFVIILAVAIILLIVLIWLVKSYKAKQQKKQKEVESLKITFANTSVQYKQKIQDLEKLEGTHRKVLGLVQQELGKAQEENSVFKKKYSEIFICYF